MTVTTETGRGTLYQRLEFQPPDDLSYSRNHADTPRGVDRSNEIVFDGLCAVVKEDGPYFPQQQIYYRLKDGIGVHHFNDTTVTAPIRMAGYVEDNRKLHSDGGNLAAMLNRLNQTNRTVYQRIVGADPTDCSLF